MSILIGISQFVSNMTTHLSSQFDKAAAHLPNILAKMQLKDDDLLYLYSRYKQSTEGKCNCGKPSFFEFQARKKWEAWSSLGCMAQDQAQAEYIERIRSLDPSWNPADHGENPVKKEGWVSVSSMAENKEDHIPDEKKNIFDWCRDGNLTAIKKILTSSNINKKDEIGLSLLHWASDRGHPEIVKYLISNKAQIDAVDAEGQTPLHYACSCGHDDVVRILLENRADPKHKDKNGETALSAAESESIKKLVSSWVFWRGSGESISVNSSSSK